MKKSNIEQIQDEKDQEVRRHIRIADSAQMPFRLLLRREGL